MKESAIHFPDDSWLYLRIYTGYHTADKLLSGILNDSSTYLIRSGLATKWFFIRYADPDFHIRYRIKMRNPAFIQEALKLLRNA